MVRLAGLRLTGPLFLNADGNPGQAQAVTCQFTVGIDPDEYRRVYRDLIAKGDAVYSIYSRKPGQRSRDKEARGGRFTDMLLSLASDWHDALTTEKLFLTIGLSFSRSVSTVAELSRWQSPEYPQDSVAYSGVRGKSSSEYLFAIYLE